MQRANNGTITSSCKFWSSGYSYNTVTLAVSVFRSFLPFFVISVPDQALRPFPVGEVSLLNLQELNVTATASSAINLQCHIMDGRREICVEGMNKLIKRKMCTYF